MCTSLLVQTGQLNNRSPNIKIAINNLDQSKLIHNSQIFVLSPNELDSEELSEIIKISLYSKNIIKKVNDINEINLNQYVWIPSKNIQKYHFLKTIYREKEISEWVLAKKVI